MRVKGALLLLCVAFLINPVQVFGQDIFPDPQPVVQELPAPTPTPIVVQVDAGEGQTTIVIPANSPWWAGIAVLISSGVIWGAKRYIDHKLKAKETEQGHEVAVVENDQTIDLTQAQSQLKLIDHIGKMVEQQIKTNERIETSEEAWREDRKNASEERGAFMKIVEAQGEKIQANTEKVATLNEKFDEASKDNKNEHRITRDKVDEINGKVDQVINLLKPRQPTGPNDPTETKDVTLEVATGILEDVKSQVSKLPEGT